MLTHIRWSTTVGFGTVAVYSTQVWVKARGVCRSSSARFRSPGRRGAQRRIGFEAILVAPGLALTARHVSDEGFKLLEERRLTKTGYSMREHGIRLFQQSVDSAPPFGLWSPSHVWKTELTDVSLLSVPDQRSCTGATLPVPEDFLSWSLMPPPKGERFDFWAIPSPSASTRVTPGSARLSLRVWRRL